MTSTHQAHQVPETTTNSRAEALMGRRDENGPVGVVLFEPIELGYECPIHHRSFPDEAEQQSLFWSEYNAFLWCALCNRDIPSALCVSGEQAVSAAQLDKAIETFLNSVADAAARAEAQLQEIRSRENAGALRLANRLRELGFENPQPKPLYVYALEAINQLASRRDPVLDQRRSPVRGLAEKALQTFNRCKMGRTLNTTEVEILRHARSVIDATLELTPTREELREPAGSHHHDALV